MNVIPQSTTGLKASGKTTSRAAPGRRALLYGWLATAAGALAVVAALMVLKSYYPPAMNDFEVYYYGGTKVLQTGETGAGALYAVRDGLPFTYPPFAAVLFA